MYRPSLLLALTLTVLSACGGDDKGDADDTGASSGGGDEGGESDLWDGANCPPEVPEAYRDLWACQTGCDGDDVLYHYGKGSSDADGNISVEESWFIFRPGNDGDVDYCMDTFEIEGGPTSYTVDTFNCTSCENIWEVRWNMTTDNDCSILWGYLFFDKDNKEKEPPYDGYLLMDTHNSFGDRNPDGNMIVYGFPVTGGSYYDVHQGDYGRGTALPSTSTDGMPEDYEWASQPVCLD